MKRLIILVVIFFIFNGCSRRPPEDAVKDITKQYVESKKGYKPLSWNTEKINFITIDIIKWGNFNKGEKYWPVKVRVRGSTLIYYWSDSSNKRRINWDKTLDLKIKLYEDDYGNKTWRRYGW